MPAPSRLRKLTGVLGRPRAWVIPYIVLWVLVGLLPITQTDLDIFFWPAAQVAVKGAPVMAYSAQGKNPNPDANGPTSLIPLTAVGLVADRLGWLSSPDERRRALALGAFSLFLLLMAREGVAAIERMRRRRLATIRGYWPTARSRSRRRSGRP